MPRFLQTGDLHLNALRKFPNYLDRARLTLSEIVRVAEERGVDFILVCGDVFDRLDITHAERQLFSDWLAEVELPIVAISGNHDKRTDEVGDTCLSYLSTLRGQLSHHFIYDGPPYATRLFDCRLILLPYQGWMDQEFHLVVESLLSKNKTTSLPTVVVAHEAVYGCKSDTGFVVTKRNQIRLDGSHPEVTYWALGDMHSCQQMRPNAWYAGAPHQTRFDEIDGKGVLVVDTDSPERPEFVPLRSIPLIVVSEVMDRWPSSVEAYVQYKPEEGCMITAALPPNVDYHPDVMLPANIPRNPVGAIAALFDGMDDALLRAGLPDDLHPLAWRLAIDLAHNLGLDISLPEKYEAEEI